MLESLMAQPDKKFLFFVLGDVCQFSSPELLQDHKFRRKIQDRQTKDYQFYLKNLIEEVGSRESKLSKLYDFINLTKTYEIDKQILSQRRLLEVIGELSGKKV